VETETNLDISVILKDGKKLTLYINDWLTAKAPLFELALQDEFEC